MTRLIIALLLCLPLAAQDTTVQVKAKAGTVQRAVNFILRSPVNLADFTCVATELEPGDSTDCTVTISRPAKIFGFGIEIVYPTELTGPTSVTIPAGGTSGTFKIVRPLSGSYLPPGTNYIGAVLREYRQNATITRVRLRSLVTP